MASTATSVIPHTAASCRIFSPCPLLRPTPSVGLAAVLGWGYVFVQGRLEEIDLAERMPGYRSYMKQVPRFFPRFGKIGKADFSSGQDDEGGH